MGIRKKILLGFVAISFILLISGVVAIFEMTRLTDLISGLLTNNIQTINSANTVDHIILKQNRSIYDIMNKDLFSQQLDLSTDTILIEEQLYFIANNITVDTEEEVAEKLYKEFEIYKTFICSVSSLPDMEEDERIIWYSAYQESFFSMIELTARLTKINQDALSENAVKLEGNYYRMIMPAVVAIIAGVFMIFFFNFFLNSYFINPIIQIKQSIRAFLSSRTPYPVKVKTNDEINELNEEVKSLVSLIKKREKECNSIQNENREA